MLNVGDKAPDFSLRDQNDRIVRLGDFLGKRLVVYFYPKDDTPGCTREGIEFTQNIQNFLKKNTEIVGISADSVDSHGKFCRKFDLGVTLLADTDRKVIDAYEVWGEKLLFGVLQMGIIRSTFLINEKGIIQKIWKPVTVPGHVEEVLEAIA